MNKNSTTSDLFTILGIAMKPNVYGNAHNQGQYSHDYNSVKEVFGKGFGDETTVCQKNNNGMTIIRHGALAHFSEINQKGFIKVTFKKDFCETRAFRFNKSEIRIIANYFNELLEEE